MIRDPQVAALLRRYHWLSLSPAPEIAALERQTCLTVGLAHFSRHFKRMVGLSPGRYLADLTA